MSIDMQPRRWARYRTTDIEDRVWDTPHYEDDAETFEDSSGRRWVRTALSKSSYSNRVLAIDDLNAVEAAHRSSAER